MQYEGTRAEIAHGFRESGNELAREKKWLDAREFYNKAIATLNGEDKWEKGDNPEKEKRKEKEIEEACYVNRALCNLELSTSSPFSLSFWACSMHRLACVLT